MGNMKKSNDVDKLIMGVLSESESALSRLITIIEDGDPSVVSEVTERLSPRKGKARRIGVTGPAGCGKSTLISKLTGVIRSDLLSVGIIAVDPSSPLTSGAVLGDRIRMQEHYLDEGVFIRSMGTRGSYGGLSRAVRLSADLLDLFGKDIIIVETIGVGQSDVAIAEVADTVVLVLTPGYGDSMQLMKAGILEIANIVVVNKADHEGSEGFIADLQEVMKLRSRKPEPPIIKAQALNNQGIEEIYKELKKTGKSTRIVL